jgi:hypothetical protein
MAPRLTSTGVRFNDNTELNSKYGIVPKNSVAVFYQTTAPTGWTRRTEHNSKALRLVNSGGGTSGGNSSFPSVFTSYNASNLTANLPASLSSFTITESEMPSHNHGMGAGGQQRRIVGGGEVASGPGYSSFSFGTSPSGGEQGHGHPFTATCTYGYSFNINVRYIDVIICQFN